MMTRTLYLSDRIIINNVEHRDYDCASKMLYGKVPHGGIWVFDVQYDTQLKLLIKYNKNSISFFGEYVKKNEKT